MEILPVKGMPLIKPGDDLPAVIAKTVSQNCISLENGDVLVLAQKIVSKAESRYVNLNDVIPGEEARELARVTDKDPRLVQVILNESRAVIKATRGVLIVEHKLGLVMANAGIDQSNINVADAVLLLPESPNQSAANLREKLNRRFGIRDLAVLINDSFGRPWRNGSCGTAIGSAGIKVLNDLRGEQDLFGRPLQVTEVAIGDELAAAASFVMGQAGEAIPLVVIKGAGLSSAHSQDASALIRSREFDLFR